MERAEVVELADGFPAAGSEVCVLLLKRLDAVEYGSRGILVLF